MSVPIYTPRPLKAEDISAKWLRIVRESIIRDSVSIRPGVASIIAYSKRQDLWMHIQLPNGHWEFETARDRDTVFAWLSGEVPIPEEDQAP